MDPTVAQWRFKVGDQVMSADDHKLGKVARIVPDATRPTHLVVEKGRLMRHDFRIPVDTICNYESGTVYVTLTEEEARITGSEPPPAPDAIRGDHP